MTTINASLEVFSGLIRFHPSGGLGDPYTKSVAVVWLGPHHVELKGLDTPLTKDECRALLRLMSDPSPPPVGAIRVTRHKGAVTAKHDLIINDGKIVKVRAVCEEEDHA